MSIKAYSLSDNLLAFLLHLSKYSFNKFFRQNSSFLLKYGLILFKNCLIALFLFKISNTVFLALCTIGLFNFWKPNILLSLFNASSISWSLSLLRRPLANLCQFFKTELYFIIGLQNSEIILACSFCFINLALYSHLYKLYLKRLFLKSS